jgi:hypothetical protein
MEAGQRDDLLKGQGFLDSHFFFVRSGDGDVLWWLDQVRRHTGGLAYRQLVEGGREGFGTDGGGSHREVSSSSKGRIGREYYMLVLHSIR